MSRLVTVREAASRLGVSPSTVKRLIKERKLAGVKVQGHWRIYEESINALLDCRSNLEMQYLLIKTEV